MRYGMEFLLAHCRIVIDLRKKKEKKTPFTIPHSHKISLNWARRESRCPYALCANIWLITRDLGQKKLPAMIVWKKKSQKSHHLALDQWITTDWANNEVANCWKRRENLHKNEMTAVISKLKHEIWKGKKGATSLFLLWSIWWYYGDQKNNISHLYHPYQLSSKILAPNLWRESKICSKLKFFGPNPNHYQPALKPPPRFPQDKDRNQKHMKKIVWDCDHYPIILFFTLFLPLPYSF